MQNAPAVPTGGIRGLSSGEFQGGARAINTKQHESSVPVSFAEALGVWLKIGLLSFGGPAAQIALMHRVLVDHARAAGREKRGGGWRRVPLYDAFQLGGRQQLDPLDLHDALERMRELDARQAGVVELRLFGGLSGEEASRILGVSVRTVERDWKMGQAWLRRKLSRGASG